MHTHHLIDEVYPPTMEQADLTSTSGIDYTMRANLDQLGIAYISLAVAWSIIVLTGMITLWFLRKNHAVRIRSFSVICGTVLPLHLYLLLILLVYPLNGLFSCSWEFWIMSILLPLGMALFQAGNVRLYSYSEAQEDLRHTRNMTVHQHCWNWRKPAPLHWWKHASVEKRTYAGICFGLIAQVVVTMVLFFGSFKFHESYGFFANHVGPAQCRRGTEWVSSVFWQFLWSTVFGPFVLLKIREIKDSHYWALQTKLAVVACLPGTPLWLLFVYAPASGMEAINKWFPASGWFLPGLVMIQVVSIAFPLCDAHNIKRIERHYGSKRQTFGTDSIYSEKARSQNSMDTFTMTLQRDPKHLLGWACTKEFTAENIIFLTQVQAFKKKWEQAAKHVENLSELQLRERYEDAALIFFTLVNAHTARMNINIDYKTYSELEEMFKGCSYEAFSDDSSSCSKGSSTYTENIVTPWADFEPPASTNADRPASSTSRRSDDSRRIGDCEVDKLYQIPVTEISTETAAEEAPVPTNFSLDVFDRAYEIVKNDVFLNTWVRFEKTWGKRPHSPPPPRQRAASFLSKV